MGLKKIFNSHGMAAPPQVYGNKVLVGKPMPNCPRVAARGSGERGRVGLGRRFAGVLAAADSLPSSGQFASAAVPEDLGELHNREHRAIGKVTVPRTLYRVYHELSRLLAHLLRQAEDLRSAGRGLRRGQGRRAGGPSGRFRGVGGLGVG